MQGWRNHMEDAHIAELDLNKCTGQKSTDLRAMFGVFDGHGGDTVSKFVSKFFLQEFLRPQNATKQYEVALANNFIRMDRCILSPEGALVTKQFLDSGA